MSKVVFLSGPMRGFPDHNRAAFHQAEKELKECGYIVLSPAHLPDGLHIQQYLDIDCAMVRACDTIACLPGFETSVGSGVERTLGGATGKRIVTVAQLKQESEGYKVLRELIEICEN